MSEKMRGRDFIKLFKPLLGLESRGIVSLKLEARYDNVVTATVTLFAENSHEIQADQLTAQVVEKMANECLGAIGVESGDTEKETRFYLLTVTEIDHPGRDPGR